MTSTTARPIHWRRTSTARGGAARASSVMSHPCDMDPAEQARGLDDQHADYDQQRHRELQLGAEVDPDDVLEHADHEAAEHGAAGAVDAAQQRACEGVQQDAA